MRILVTGANGQLGRELHARLTSLEADLGALPAVYREAQVDYVGRNELDITREDLVRAWFSTHPAYDLVINCASATNVDRCEAHEDEALLANATAVRHLAIQAQEHRATLVHISTDYVFPGTSAQPYVETDKTGPLSAYGRTKLAGEREALAACDRTFVVRTSWLYGRYGNNFVRTMCLLGATRDTVTVVDDQFGCPTYANDLAYELLCLATTKAYGIYHCSGNGACSWYEFACAIMAARYPACRVVPCSSEQYAREHPQAAHRPAYSALRNLRLEQTIGDRMRPWRKALGAFFANGNPFDEPAGVH